MNQLSGKALIIAGVVLVIIGLVLVFGDKVPFLGKLPGDITIRTKNGRFYFPLVSCLVISVILTLVLKAFTRK